MGKLEFFLLFLFVLIGKSVCFAQNDLIFPVFANTSTADCATSCRYWFSYALAFNPNDTATTVTFTSYDANGNVISSIGPRSVAAFQAINPGGGSTLRTGWLKISSSQPLIGRAYLLDKSVTRGVEDVRSQIDLSAASLTRRHFVRPESFGPIGLSIVFPSTESTPARGKLIHRNDDGQIVSEKDLVIAPNGQLIGYLKDLLPPEPGGNPILPLSGSFEIVFDQNVAVTALQFSASEPLEEVVVEAFSGGMEVQ
jgi:hypothetical protein